MGYVVCEKCGGYYKLVEGEFPEDFEACNCGGKLTYVKSIQKEVKNPKNAIKCNICGHEQEKGLTCSKCGSKIRKKVNYQNYRNKYDYGYIRAGGSSVNFFERIQWKGVTSGIVFYIVALIVIWLVSVVFSGGAFLAVKNASSTALLPVIGTISAVLGVISAIIPVASGFWAVSTITTMDYITGMITGGMVGVIIAVVLGILSLIVGLLFSGFYGQVNIVAVIAAGVMGLVIAIIYGGAVTAAGGLIAVYVRNHTYYI